MTLEEGSTVGILAEYYKILRSRSISRKEIAFDALADLLGGGCMAPVLEAVEEMFGAPLGELGFEALLLVPGRGFQIMPLHAARIGPDRYLLDEVPVFYLGSCHLAGQVSRQRSEFGNAGFALLGPPPLTGPSALPEAAEEIESLRDLLESRGLPVQVLSETDMTIGALIDTLRRGGRPAALHLATHASFSAEAPLKSHVQFSGENLSLDRLLRDPDLDLRGTGLVYLSSCDAGWMEGIWDEDPQGLVYGFLHAGAGAVMASLLPVLDESARLLAELFYEEAVVRGRSLAEAHRAAVRRLREIDDGLYANPLHWAPMMLHGRALSRLTSSPAPRSIAGASRLGAEPPPGTSESSQGSEPAR